METATKDCKFHRTACSDAPKNKSPRISSDGSGSSFALCSGPEGKVVTVGNDKIPEAVCCASSEGKISTSPFELGY